MPSSLPLLNSIFVGSFNVNDADLSNQDANALLKEAKDADLVVLAFQECGSCPNESMPLPFGTDSCHQDEEYCRLSKEALERNEGLLKTLHTCLGNDMYSIVADVAMGESATGKKVMVKEEKVEWYGYIRMIVFAKSNLASALQAMCKTFVCPSGSKPSVDSLASKLPDYSKQSSPDKGAVCVLVGDDLLLTNVHLHGTNKYNVPEKGFDKIRIEQLKKIGSVCSKEAAADWRYCIVAGDFNFRCEVHPSDKSRGGQDFQAVHNVITSGDKEAVSNLFNKCDRLLQLLRAQDEGKDDFPLLLKNTQDVFCHAFDHNECILPTFTFSGEGESRFYSDKRTPSWTDRVLLSNELLEAGFCIQAVGSIPSIAVSDHIPVYCRLNRHFS